MAEVAVITMPEQFADSVSDFSKREARIHFLQDALLEAHDEVWAVAEMDPGDDASGYPKRLMSVAARVQAIADEMIRVAGSPRHVMSLRIRQRDMSYKELAEHLGVHAGVVVRWEGGEPIPEPHLSRLCELFDVPPEWLTENGEGR